LHFLLGSGRPGEETNDLPKLVFAGLFVAPACAHVDVKKKVRLITQQNGGHGAVRELIDHVLRQLKKITYHDS